MYYFKKLILNDQFIFWLIVANAILIFFEGFAIHSEIFSSIISSLDAIFTLIFIAEALVKIRESGFSGYFSSGWNRLDFILIVLSAPSLIYFFGLIHTDLSFLLFFRIARVFKFFRFFKYFPEVGKIAAGVRRASHTAVFVLVGVLVYNLIVSVLSFYIFHKISNDFYGDPFLSFFSTFRIFTVEGWYEIPDLISKGMPEWKMILIKFYFTGILITGGIFGLSLVNSIFVDTMMSDNNDELNESVKYLSKKIDALTKKIEELEEIEMAVRNDKKIIED